MTLSRNLIRAVAAQPMPDQSCQIGVFVAQMERVGRLFEQLFSSTQTVICALDTLYDVMTGTGRFGGSFSICCVDLIANLAHLIGWLLSFALRFIVLLLIMH